MAKTGPYVQWSLEPYCIGLKLRSLRIQKRLTLSRLAAETGLSTALLSKIETDRMIPTLPTLATICRVYGVGLGHFFNEPSRHNFSITRKEYLQRDGQGVERIKTTPLHTNVSRLNAQLLEFPPGAPPLALHANLETVGLFYVLEGRLRVDVGGMHEILETGDCACIDSLMPMGWSAADKRRCRVLGVLVSASEKTE